MVYYYIVHTHRQDYYGQRRSKSEYNQHSQQATAIRVASLGLLPTYGSYLSGFSSSAPCSSAAHE